MRRPQDRIITIEAAAAWRQALRDRGQDLVVTNGCFDVLHAGHVQALYAARSEGDALLVLLNSDESVRRAKGPGRPICGVKDRATMLAALRCVDAVVIFEGADCALEMEALEPDVYVKSAEYISTQNPAEKAALEHCGVRVVWIARSAHSTSGVVERIRGAAPEPPAGEHVPPHPPELQAAADTADAGGTAADATASPQPAGGGENAEGESRAASARTLHPLVGSSGVSE